MDEARRETVVNAIHDALAGLNGILTGFVVAATYIGPAGDQRIYVDSGDEMPASSRLGLLEGMAAIERAKIVRSYFDEDTDDDQ